LHGSIGLGLGRCRLTLGRGSLLFPLQPAKCVSRLPLVGHLLQGPSRALYHVAVFRSLLSSGWETLRTSGSISIARYHKHPVEAERKFAEALSLVLLGSELPIRLPLLGLAPCQTGCAQVVGTYLAASQMFVSSARNSSQCALFCFRIASWYSFDATLARRSRP